MTNVHGNVKGSTPPKRHLPQDIGPNFATYSRHKSVGPEMKWPHLFAPWVDYSRETVHTLNVEWRLGGETSNIFYFHPDPWGNDPIWLIFFKMGWFNHQPEDHFEPWLYRIRLSRRRVKTRRDVGKVGPKSSQLSPNAAVETFDVEPSANKTSVNWSEDACSIRGFCSNIALVLQDPSDFVYFGQVIRV